MLGGLPMILSIFGIVLATLATLAGWRFLAATLDRELLAEANAAPLEWEVKQ